VFARLHLNPVINVLNLGDLLGKVFSLFSFLDSSYGSLQSKGSVVGTVLNVLGFQGVVRGEGSFVFVFDRAVKLGFLGCGFDFGLQSSALDLDSIDNLIFGRGLFGNLFGLVSAVRAADDSTESHGSGATILRDSYAAQIFLVERVINGHSLVRVLAVTSGEGQSGCNK
jgi:hypothetical protein